MSIQKMAAEFQSPPPWWPQGKIWDPRGAVSTAYHEAGQAVVARALGRWVCCASIGLDEDQGWTGFVGHSVHRLDDSAQEKGKRDRLDEELEEALMVSLAGSLADNGNPPIRCPHLRQERGNREEGCEIVFSVSDTEDGTDPYFDLRFERTRNLLWAHWSRVETVARALVAKGWLPEEEIGSLLSGIEKTPGQRESPAPSNGEGEGA